MREEESPQAIGRRILAICDHFGIEKQELARIVGKTPPAVSNWVAGSNKPSIENMLALCHRYRGLSLDYIFRGELAKLPHDLAEDLSRAEARISTKRSKDRRNK